MCGNRLLNLLSQVAEKKEKLEGKQEWHSGSLQPTLCLNLAYSNLYSQHLSVGACIGIYI